MSVSYTTVDQVVARVLATAPLPHAPGHAERVEESNRRLEAHRIALTARQEGPFHAR
jgi:hypothetical protein